MRSEASRPNVWPFALPLVAALLSGAAGLAYEVLWFRLFAVTFGASARAAGVVLAAFFVGSAIGARLIAPVADRLRAPLIWFAVCEAAVALSALLPMSVRESVAALYARGAVSLGIGSPALVAVALGLAAATMLPAAAAMGASLPALMRGCEDLRRPGARTAALYAVQLLGAGIGTLLTAFVAHPALGSRKTLACAMLASLLAASAALAAAPRALRSVRSETHPATRVRTGPVWRLLALAAGSGALLIGLETLWTRLLGLVLRQEVCCFASVLFTVLVGLALGSALASLLLRRRADAVVGPLSALLSVTGLATLASPAILYAITRFRLFDAGSAPTEHALAVVGLSCAVLLVPCVLAGTGLPLVLALLERRRGPSARVIGRALAWNALAAAVGAIAAAEALLPRLSVHGAILAFGASYGVLGLIAFAEIAPQRRSVLTASLAALTLTLGASLAIQVVPDGRLPAGVRYERYTASGVLRVREAGPNLVMTLDNHYTLGGTRSREAEALQVDLPLRFHSGARDVACIGLATGATAAGALDHPIRSLTVFEIVPEVREAAERFPDGRRVLADPRTRLVMDDGRLALSVETREYDLIVCDLVLPWEESAGWLYTREHFRIARNRLRSGGAFWLWLPLYQMSEREFAILARTFLQVFPDAEVVRGDFSRTRPIVALVGSRDGGLGEADEDARAYHAGPLALPHGAPDLLNTDDHPVVPYLAAESRRRRDAFTGEPLERYLRGLRPQPGLSRARGAPPRAQDPERRSAHATPSGPVGAHASR